jgi:hypothetical protein
MIQLTSWRWRWAVPAAVAGQPVDVTPLGDDRRAVSTFYGDAWLTEAMLNGTTSARTRDMMGSETVRSRMASLRGTEGATTHGSTAATGEHHYPWRA